MNDIPPATGFDAVAPRYDADESQNMILRRMRERAYVRLSNAFAAGERLLELGSGTGTDAARLSADRGCRVALVDPSSRLLEKAASKLRAVRADALLGAHAMPARSVGELADVYGSAAFDGAYSNFGPLNCEPALVPIADGLARLVRAGGCVVLSVMNRWCPPEVLWFALHGQWAQAARRWGKGPVRASAYAGGPRDVPTWYYSRREVESAFAAEFRVEHAEALPLLWPPPYFDFLYRRFERLFRLLEPLDAWAAQRPGLRELGDHVLLRLRRR